ncbi:MAG: diguanylate cyclase [Paenibacillaceae bacterium]|jgi:diguanylate cyclase (GGDEF)-like protein|nr:diguanylate cyclase [Paenibacillaceae bacterium]
MQKIPVTRDGKKGSETIIINSDDIVKIDRLKDREYIVHTADDQYFLDISLDSIEEWLFEEGFRLIDSSNIVNMNNVTKYDARKGVVYLADAEQNKIAKTASAARIHKDHIENLLELFNRAKEEPENEEYQQSFSDWMKSKIVETEDDRLLRSYATVQAVNEHKKAQEKIMHMAYHDLLTDLPNRPRFHAHLTEKIEEAHKQQKMLAVIFLGLDRLKIINDSLGHVAGDKLLQTISKRLMKFLPKEIMASRFGGDEFMILLPEINHVDEVKNFIKSLSPVFSEPYLYDKHELALTTSQGIAVYPHDGTDADLLIKNAHVALSRAKKKGGNIYQFYHPQMNKNSLHRLNLEIHLRRAFERNEFVVYYQPLVDLTTGTIIGMEALVRWIHPEWGMISPGEFIPIAEETGLISSLGKWVLKQACVQNHYWLKVGYPPLCVSVNISANQFHQHDFLRSVESILEITGLAPDQLCLEITETVAMQNVSSIMETLNKLRKLGIRMAIDDFGTGYSSLNYLKQFRVEMLKIDQSFTRDLNIDEDNAAIVSALLTMSRQLRIRTLAEGVETKEQLNFLRERGCDQIQGYYFSPPLPGPEFEQMLKDNRNIYELAKR